MAPWSEQSVRALGGAGVGAVLECQHRAAHPAWSVRACCCTRGSAVTQRLPLSFGGNGALSAPFCHASPSASCGDRSSQGRLCHSIFPVLLLQCKHPLPCGFCTELQGCLLALDLLHSGKFFHKCYLQEANEYLL